MLAASRMLKIRTYIAVVCMLCPLVRGGWAATFKTKNFVVSAATDEIAQRVGRLAEHYRSTLAVEWLGKEMPPWYRPCTISVKTGRMGAGGATSFNFDRGEVYGWRMEIQGSLERVLDSVLPHEVNHTIFASYFRRPLPRWADEGAATLTEHESEKHRQRLLLGEVMKSGERFPMRQLLAMKEYPSGGRRRVLTMYAQGWSLADYLVQRGGKTKFLEFLEDAHRRDWDRAFQSHYGFQSVDNVEKTWGAWVAAGSPNVRADGTMLAGSRGRDSLPEGTVVRGQNPDTFAAPDPSPRRGLDERSVPREMATPPLPAVASSTPLTLREVVERDPGWSRASKGRQPRPVPLGSYRTPIRRDTPPSS